MTIERDGERPGGGRFRFSEFASRSSVLSENLKKRIATESNRLVG